MCSGKYDLGNRKWNYLLEELNNSGGVVTKYMGGQPNKENTAGYCTNKKHKGALTVKMIKNHHCLERKCVFFRKCEEHQYWEQKSKLKKCKQVNKKQNKVQGTKETKTGSGGFRKSSLKSKQFKDISKFFENQQIFYLYTFNDIPESLKYTNGFYSLDSIITWIGSQNYSYYVVVYQKDDKWNYIGYRKNNLGVASKIDLSWGDLYPKLLIATACDVAVKSRYHLWE